MSPYTPSSLQRHIRSHSVFIFDVEQKHFGSGVLIDLAGRVFVLSAAHVIDADVDISFGIVPHQTRFAIVDKWVDEHTDVGFLELSRSEVLLRLSQHGSIFEVGSKKARATPSMNPTFALCGFPGANAVKTNRGLEIPLTYVTVSLLAPEQWPTELNPRFDRRHTFVIPYGPKWGSRFLDANKNPTEALMPHGMSGCGLWYFDPDTEDEERPTYALGGVQHTYIPSLQIVLGTLIDKLIDEVADHCGIDLTTNELGGAP